ncbi:hypothetical protein CRE_24046 [Caenorhabditis remanei]|uniref:Uncharacterized protein n=1 Tax=Caenorhabditis remanei TaxID=31234 RepID=E3MG78_CAERE|nr:hypothetical protein CRE_24046 [Caenorhabditis remanei]
MDVLNATNDLLPLLPEVQDALSEDFDGVECSMGAGVVLAQAPFRMTFAHMGRQVTFVPDTSCLEEFDGAKLHRINLGPVSFTILLLLLFCLPPPLKLVHSASHDLKLYSKVCVSRDSRRNEMSNKSSHCLLSEPIVDLVNGQQIEKITDKNEWTEFFECSMKIDIFVLSGWISCFITRFFRFKFHIPSQKFPLIHERKLYNEKSEKSAVFTDGEPGCCMELILGAGKDWKTPLTKLFTRIYPNKWAFFITELESGQASYHVLSSSHGMVSSPRREDTPDSTEQSSMVSSPTASVSDATNYSLWIVPVTKVFAIPAPKKVKVIRKVIKKRTPVDGSVNGSVIPNGTSNGTITTNGHTNGTTEDGERKVRYSVCKWKNSIQMTSFQVRLVKKKPVEKLESSTDREISPLNDIPKAEFATVSSSESTKTVVNGKTEKEEAGPSNDSSDGSASELRKKLTEKMMEQKFMVNGEQRALNGSASSRAIGRSISRSSMTPDRRLDPIFEDGANRKQSISSAIAANRPAITRNSATPPSTPKTLVSHPSKPNIPVIALQAVLTNWFNYEHLGRLREVHPHWDEIAGQLLNSGYYKLLERSDKLLMALQRKVVSDPGLHYATSVLTNIQVHVLNPVDIMRAVIDEGVCCFPYGVILDKTFLLLDRVEAMLHGSYEEECHWEPVAKLAKKAASHYRGNLERVMEERMGENLRLKAAQRIIRLESFVVDAQVAKLEKESNKAKEDVRWEIDQLHQKNSQLRKDNRELRANQMRLEARVDALEQKFKTLARLLS